MCRDAIARRPVEKLKKSVYPSAMSPEADVGEENWFAVDSYGYICQQSS